MVLTLEKQQQLSFLTKTFRVVLTQKVRSEDGCQRSAEGRKQNKQTKQTHKQTKTKKSDREIKSQNACRRVGKTGPKHIKGQNDF